MADQSDVENALVTIIAGALYPNGTSSPSVPGPDCRVYRGWPQSAALDTDLAAGRINVTVFPAGGAGRNTTRYAEQWVATPQQPTLTASMTDGTIAFGGTADPGQLAGVLADQHSYVYRTQAGDTPALVAANLAALVRADFIVQQSAASLAIPAAGDVVVRVVADASAMREVRRQRQTFRITCWCPTPPARDAAAAAIDQAMAAMRFMPLADGTDAWVRYAGTTVFDQSQDALLYRRDLLYAAEYATTITALQPSMLFGDLLINAASFIA